MEPTISVMILGGDRVFAEALEAVLAAEEGLRLRAASATPAETDDPPSILLIDASSDPAAALALTWSARERFPEAQVVILGLQREDEGVLEFIEAGAAAYLLQSASPAQLIEALHFLREGQVHSSPRIAAAVVERIAALEKERKPVPPPQGWEPLTEREREILELVAQGRSNADITAQLVVSPKTVRNHVSNIFSKLQVRDRSEAIVRAREAGMGGSDAAGRGSRPGPPSR